MSVRRVRHEHIRPEVNQRFTGFHFGFLAVLILVNLAVVAFAWQDRSWGALNMAIVTGPIMNALFCAAALAATPLLRRLRPPAHYGWHFFASILFPVVAIAVDALLILNMDLQGC